MNYYPVRRDRLLAQLQAEQLPGLLVTNPLNVTYLTGFSGEASYLIVTPKKTLLVSDGRFADQLKEECPDLEVVIRPAKQKIVDATVQALEGFGLTALEFESDDLTVAEYQQLSDQLKSVEWKPGEDRVAQLRQVKDAWEVEQIRSAIVLAEKAFAMFRAMIRPGDNEKDLSDAMEMYVRRAGGKSTSFPTIVAGGVRAALPHAPLTERAVGGEIVVLIDWGASGPFYKSDLTRVLIPHNNPGLTSDSNRAKLRAVYDVVLRAQAQAIAAIRPGVKTGDVDAAARKVIADAGYGEQFTHSIGHGLGMEVHEAPIMRPESEMVLQAGMVVTVEPGVYLPGWAGVRIEDDVLVTPESCEVLSGLAREFDSSAWSF